MNAPTELLHLTDLEDAVRRIEGVSQILDALSSSDTIGQLNLGLDLLRRENASGMNIVKDYIDQQFATQRAARADT